MTYICKITGNPSGTDTWTVGQDCQCESCQAWLKDPFRESLSRPRTLGDLSVGSKFIVFPTDGDDEGHGGFRGACRIFTRIESKRPEPGLIYHESYRLNCVDKRGNETSLPLSIPVLEVVE